jgi:type II secretory pathway component HofQ
MTIPKAFLLLAGALLLSANAFSTGAAASPLDAKLDIQVKEAPLAQFLDTLSAQTKTSFVLTDGTEKMRVTLDAKDQKASELLKTVLESKGLTYQRSGQSSTYLVITKAQDADYLRRDELLKKNATLDSRVTIAVRAAPLKIFLDTMSEQTRVSFKLAPGLEKYRVSLDLQKTPAREALEIVLTMKGLDLVSDGQNGFTVRPGPRTARL